MHKLHHIGMSGVIFTKCGDVRSGIDYINATENDAFVTCEKCLEIMASQAIDSDTDQTAGRAGH